MKQKEITKTIVTISKWKNPFVSMVSLFQRFRGQLFNPLNPHDALKHHFIFLKTDLIFLQLRVLDRKFPWNWFTNMW